MLQRSNLIRAITRGTHAHPSMPRPPKRKIDPIIHISILS
jgi:hypothetical protein